MEDWAEIRRCIGLVRVLRPLSLPPDPASQTEYVAGERMPSDLWFTPVACPTCRVMLSDALRPCWPPSGAEPPPYRASPTPRVPECTVRAEVLVSGPLECPSAYKADFGTHGGGGAGKILKKIQAWLSIRRQGVRRR